MSERDLATSIALHEQTQRILQETMAVLSEALALLETCRQCDLIYGLAFARGCGNYDDPRTVADEVDDFLKKHKP